MLDWDFSGEKVVSIAQSLDNEGCSLVQIRAKNLAGNSFFHFVQQVLRAVSPKCRIIVNDRLDIALAAGAAGVHLGESDLPLEAARRLAPPGFILGATCRSPQEARRAEQAGASYLGAGAVFPTASKSDTRLIGLEGLAAICAAVSLPVYGIAGITADNAAQVIGCGAYGCAGISALGTGDQAGAEFRELERRLTAAAGPL